VSSPRSTAGNSDVGGLGSKHARPGFATRAVHPPRPTSQAGEPLSVPVDFSSTYSFADVDEFARASEIKVGAGYVYTRWGNPTIDAFEAAVAELEGAPQAEAFASGMAAITTTILALCDSGDRIVAARQLYGGTHEFFSNVLPRFGIRAELFDVKDLDGIERALDGARLLYCETIGNPRVKVADLDRLGAIAQAAGVMMIVDSTFASPVLCRPMELGASAVVHSATKFLGGHHDLLGGVVCASEDVIEHVRALARELGAIIAPFTAWLALRGMQTLPLRVERACASARAVAEALENHPAIGAVFYPALDSSEDRDLCDSLLGGRGGGVLAFDVAGGRERARSFQEKLRLVKPAASLGGSHSLIVHAASVTHTQLSPQELTAAGISEGFCRLSVGLEDPEDLIADLHEALDVSGDA
jgi:cystathionine beta-lyase/cystathionine gamma-synthase